MICYHGTTEKGLKAILEGGRKPNNPWSVSDNDGCMYFWPSDKLADEYLTDNIEDQGIQRGFESAQVQAAVSQEEKLIVISINVPDEMLSDDLSCENMENTASYIYCSDFNKSMIVKTFEFTMNKWAFPFVIKSLLNNEYFNEYCIEDDLLRVAQMLPDNTFIDELLEFDWQEVTNHELAMASE